MDTRDGPNIENAVAERLLTGAGALPHVATSRVRRPVCARRPDVPDLGSAQ